MSQGVDKEHEFKILQAQGKELASEGRLKESLQKFLLAKDICATDKVLRRIKKLEECIAALERSLYIGSSSIPDAKANEMDTIHLKSENKNSVQVSKVLNDIKNLQVPVEGSYKEGAKQKALSSSLYTSASPKKESSTSESDEPKISVDYSYTDYADKKTFSPSFNSRSSKKESKVPDSRMTATVLAVSNEDQMRQIKDLYQKSRELAASGNLMDALDLLKDAQNIRKTEKIENRIKNLEKFIAENDVVDSDNAGMVEIADGFSVYNEIYNKLYPYQREGVAWMWSIHKMNKGGVLGDDMGLGKTFQVIAFLSGLFDSELAKCVLIIMPVSLLPNWKREFNKWCPGIAVFDFHGQNKRDRERNLLRVQRRGNVLLTSYGMLVKNAPFLTELDGDTFVWDYVILDEGHKIKNPTKTTKAVHSIPSKHRLVLTGTPIQNNLKELWSLFDFVQQGSLLGSLKTFKLHVENPITRAREKDASADERKLGTKMAENLKEVIKPYFLRRTKEEIWGDENKSNDVESLGTQFESMQISKLESRKNDLILWVVMSKPQIEIYSSFLMSDDVKRILVSKRSPLVELTTLKKICDHPRLLTQRACLELGLDGETGHENMELSENANIASSIDNVTDETLLIESGKLQLVIKLLEKLKEEGHRTLVFSLSRKILDMIHRILANKKWKIMRVDGTISSMDERAKRIQKFQTDTSYPVFLLTTQVGGVGITLTAADRVIIYDPSWNPATDAQAVDRAYRIGQDKDVVVYRLITCGTVEEKIYRRQIFKDSINRQATGVASDPYRYFSKQELRELFSLGDPYQSVTQIQLSDMHSSERQTDNNLEKHITFLNTLNIFGISDHDLMFKNVPSDEVEHSSEQSAHFIENQVARATQLIHAEAAVTAEGLQLSGNYFRPYQELIPLAKKSAKSSYKPPVIPDVIDLTENAQDLSNFKQNVRKSYEKSRISEIVNDPYKLSDVPETIDLTENAQDILVSKQTTRENSDKSSSETETDSYHTPGEGEIIDLATEQTPTKEISSKSSETTSSSDESENGRLFQTLSSKRYSLPLQKPLKLFNIDKKEHMNSFHNFPFRQSTECLDPVDFETSKNVGNIITEESHTDKVSNEVKCEREPSMLLDDLDFDKIPSRNSKFCKRISCARPSAFHLLDSDSSHHSSCPSSANTTLNLVNDSDNGMEDSSNSASISFVPDSASNTPDSHNERRNAVCVETPLKHSFRNSDLLTGNSGAENLIYDGSVKRITPLKIDRSKTNPDSHFVQALAASPILTPQCSPEKKVLYSTNTSVQKVSQNVKNELSLHNIDNGDDSPIKMQKRKKPLALLSDESDTEYENDNGCSRHQVSDTSKSNNDNGHNKLSGCIKNYESESNSSASESDDCHDKEQGDKLANEHDRSSHSRYNEGELNSISSESNDYSDEPPTSKSANEHNRSSHSRYKENESDDSSSESNDCDNNPQDKSAYEHIKKSSHSKYFESASDDTTSDDDSDDEAQNNTTVNSDKPNVCSNYSHNSVFSADLSEIDDSD